MRAHLQHATDVRQTASCLSHPWSPTRKLSITQYARGSQREPVGGPTWPSRVQRRPASGAGGHATETGVVSADGAGMPARWQYQPSEPLMGSQVGSAKKSQSAGTRPRSSTSNRICGGTSGPLTRTTRPVMGAVVMAA